MTDNDEVYAPLKKIYKKYNIPLFNHFCDTMFVDNPDFFYDSVHMNRYGATKYTKILTKEIKHLK